MKNLPHFGDLFKFNEDKRIDIIGSYAMRDGKVVGFVVEDEKKANRYIKKLKEKFPMVKETGRFMLAGQVCVKVQKIRE